MICIFTHSNSICTKEYWKWFARKITNKYSGPKAVEDSLARGLQLLSIPFSENRIHSKDDVVVVLSGVHALKENIARKNRGEIRKLLAGPNIISFPKDHGALMADPAIDAILVPSSWVVDFWKHELPELANRITVWPSGVEISEPTSRDGAPIIYDKIGNVELLSLAKRVTGDTARVFTYGNFKRDEYLHALESAPYLIYLSKSESQGIALQEAWACDVPTFVNASNMWVSDGYSWSSENINCPYLSDEYGAVFESESALKTYVERAHTFHPKKHCDAQLSDAASARKLLEHI